MKDLLTQFWNFLIASDLYFSSSSLILFAVFVYKHRMKLFTDPSTFTIIFSFLWCVLVALTSWLVIKFLPLVLFIYYKPFLGLFDKDVEEVEEQEIEKGEEQTNE